MGKKNEINIVCSLSYVELRLKNTHMHICIYVYAHAYIDIQTYSL